MATVIERVTLPPDLGDWARAQAEQEGLTLTAWTRSVLARWRAIQGAREQIRAIASANVHGRVITRNQGDML